MRARAHDAASWAEVWRAVEGLPPAAALALVSAAPFPSGGDDRSLMALCVLHLIDTDGVTARAVSAVQGGDGTTVVAGFKREWGPGRPVKNWSLRSRDAEWPLVSWGRANDPWAPRVGPVRLSDFVAAVRAPL